MKGLFFVFEGIDGSGKSTQALKFTNFVFSQFKRADCILLTREPTFNKFGLQLRELFTQTGVARATDPDPKSKGEEALKLYVKDRKHHLENFINPVLEKNGIVVCDRFKHSTLAYQHAQGIPIERIVKAHKGLAVPNFTFIFDLPAETAFERLSKHAERQNEFAVERIKKFEKLEFLEKVRENYLKIPKIFAGERIEIINAEKSIEEVFQQVLEKAKPLLKF